MSLIKLGAANQAVVTCDEAAEAMDGLDPRDSAGAAELGKAELAALRVKLLFRRGCACIGADRWEEAQRDLQAVLELDPDNAAAKRELKRVGKLQKKQDAKDHARFKKMFGK